MTIKELVSKYHSNRDNYLKESYNETQLRSDFLNPFFEILGWDINNDGCKKTNEREVLLEESIKPDISEYAKKPDYTFRLFAERKFFLEAKKPSVSIETSTASAKQIRRYGFTAKLKISVLSNFEYLLIYDCSVKVEENDSHDKALIKKYHYTEYEDEFDEICQLLGRESVYTGRFEEEWKSIEDKLMRFSVNELFLNQINEWRILFGKEIFKHNKKITEKLLNDYVQSYINRIIFLRVCEDRNLENYQTLLNFADQSNFEDLLNKFSQADKKYNSGLFNQFLSNEIISNISSVFWFVIRQLYYPESPYSFAVFSSDILGNIYEIFLSEKLVIQDGLIMLKKKEDNVDRDVITTPNFIIQSTLNHTVIPFCQGKTDKEILTSKFADIACGSGAFLLEVFQLLNDTLVDYYLKNDISKLRQTNINTYKLSYKYKRELLLNCIFGIDKDFNAVESAKFGLLLKLLEDEDNISLNSDSQILPDLSNNIVYGNTLVSSKDIKNKKYWAEINPYDFGKVKYDVIVGNPPYMKSEDMKKITPLEYPIYKKKYYTSYKQFDKYFLFIERAINLLKDNGWIGYILPSKFTKVGSGYKLRDLLKKEGYIYSLISFGASQVFSTKTTYTCLLILRKAAHVSFKYTEVKNLATWKIDEKNSIDYQDVEFASLNNDVWVLIPTELKPAYDKINSQSILLKDIVGSDGIFNGIQTSANEIYVFQIINEDKNFYYFNKEGKDWKIEKEITRPYFKTSSGEDNLNTYRVFKPNARVIYPYYENSSGINLLSLKEIKNYFPCAYKYLINYKPLLNSPYRSIKPTPKNRNEWHRYGRHQSLDKCTLPQKIIVGVLSVGNKYAIDISGTLISSGGTAGYCVISIPNNSLYSIYYIQALLNSKYLEWFSSIYGEVFRGGYIARGTKVLKRLPIRKINFDNKREKKIHDEIVKIQKKLIHKQEEIDRSIHNQREIIVLRREFNALSSSLSKILNNLYNLGQHDTLIPKIEKDL